jgi:imidazolonepropionase
MARSGEQLRNLSLIDAGAMLFSGGTIQWVGPAADAPNAYEVIDHSGRVITPGLVDAHTHAVFGGNRANEFERRALGATYQEIAAEGGGIQSTVAATRAASEEELVAAGKRYAQWFLTNGTTTLEAKSGYGLTTKDEVKILRAIARLNRETPLDYVPTFLGAHAFPPEFKDNQKGYVDLICNEMLPVIAQEGLAECADAFCEERYFDRAATARVLNRAKELGLKTKLHADQLTLCGGATLAAELRTTTADHLEQTDLAGIRALKKAGVQPVLLPASVYALGLSHYPAARTMIDEGLAVVLASDFNPGSSPTTSLPFVMSLACTHMGMTPAEALIACTINAACALGRGEDRGSLEIGKRADFVVWDCQDPREIAYWIAAPLAQEVYVRGERVFSRARSG